MYWILFDRIMRIFFLVPTFFFDTYPLYKNHSRTIDYLVSIHHKLLAIFKHIVSEKKVGTIQQEKYSNR